MKKFLVMLTALVFVTATSGLVLAQGNSASTPVKKVHKAHKAKKKHHSKKKAAPKVATPAAQ